MSAHLGPVAVIPAGPARAIGVVLRHASREGVFDGMAPGARGAVLAAISDLEAVGRAAVFADARTQTPEAATLAESLSVAEVATLTGLTQARVRQLGPRLGVKVAGQWRLDPEAVAAEVERRGSS